jgi:probable addiction module antidote protein
VKEFEEDGDVNALLDTLRLVAQAQGGIAKLARETAISRKALYEALSPAGNPRLRTFQSVLEALGFRMSLRPFHGHAGVRWNSLGRGKKGLVPHRWRAAEWRGRSL